jgi:hypothetical protein
MAALIQHQHHGIQSVLGKQLRAPDDDCDKTDGIKQIRRNRKGRSRVRKRAPTRHRQARQTHRQATGDSRKRQLLARASKLVTRVIDGGAENLRGGEPACIGRGFFVNILARDQLLLP